MNSDLAALQERLGYTFKSEELLIRALTHPSYVQQFPGAGKNNQRLEFLGDAVLSVILAEKLFEIMPDEREGGLSRSRAALARGETLAELARELDITPHILLSDAEEQNYGRSRNSIREDALEAIVCAIYLDSGSLDETRNVILGWYGDLEERIRESRTLHNPKGILQETIQPEHGNNAIDYIVIEESGPDHSKHFLVEVRILGEPHGRGEGPSKKDAEEAAAREALTKLSI